MRLFKRVILVMAVTLAIIMWLNCPVLAVETETTTPTVVETTQKNSDGILDVFKGTIQLVSFIVATLLPSLILIIWGKEMPKKQVPLFSLVFFVVVVLYRLLRFFFPQIEWVEIAYLTIIFIFISIAWVFIYNKYIISTPTEEVLALTKPEKKAMNFMKSKIRNGHNAIESIQLYTYKERDNAGTTEYEIEYIDGVMKQQTEINAMLRMHLCVDHYTWEMVKGIVSLYDKYNNGNEEAPQGTLRTLLETSIAEESKRIKEILSNVKNAKDVVGTDCCLARVLMVYCSILASLEKETIFVGFGENALGLKEDVEQTLFTQKRTGILGAILLENYPYGFYYNRAGEKRGRTYCSFICRAGDKKYLVLVAFRMREGMIVPDIGVSNALTSIRERLNRIFDVSNKEAVNSEV